MAVRFLVAASALLMIALAGCSGDGGGSAEVAIHDFKFDPASVSVAAGDSVTFVNHDSARHTATADGGAFDVDLPGDGGTGRVTVSSGTYAYHCKLHASMRGTLVVA